MPDVRISLNDPGLYDDWDDADCEPDWDEPPSGRPVTDLPDIATWSGHA